MKHIDPILAMYEMCTTQETRNIIISVELWSQLISPRIVNHLYSNELIWNKMNTSAASFYSINQNRFDEILYGPIIGDTVRIAYAHTMSRDRKSVV